MSLLKQIIGEIVEFDFGIKLNKEHSITVLCSDSKINIINFNDKIYQKRLNNLLSNLNALLNKRMAR